MRQVGSRELGASAPASRYCQLERTVRTAACREDRRQTASCDEQRGGAGSPRPIFSGGDARRGEEKSALLELFRIGFSSRPQPCWSGRCYAVRNSLNEIGLWVFSSQRVSGTHFRLWRRVSRPTSRSSGMSRSSQADDRRECGWTDGGRGGRRCSPSAIATRPADDSASCRKAPLRRNPSRHRSANAFGRTDAGRRTARRRPRLQAPRRVAGS